MKRLFVVANLMALFIALATPIYVFAGGLRESKVVFGGEFTLPKDEIIDGDLVVLGGQAELQEGSKVTGNIALLGGRLTCFGRVEGDVVGFGGDIALQSPAVVRGKVILFGSSYEQQEGAQVSEVLRFESLRPYATVPPFRFELPNPEWLTRSWMKWGGFLFRVFAWTALAILCGLLFPRPMERIADAVRNQVVIAGVVGLISVVVLSVGIFLLAITLILLPVSFLGFLLVVIGWFMGIISIGLETGRRITEWLKQSWSLPIMAGVGTFALVFITNGVSSLIPCVGWIIPFTVGMVGFGAVIMTQFGLKEVI